MKGTTTIYDLPQELLDSIINYVPDRSTLKACALTHRTWTRASQAKLHAARLFNWQEHAIRDATLYSNPGIASMVRSLELIDPPSPTEDETGWMVLSRLTSITSLKIVCMDWLYCTADVRARLSAAFTRVTRLMLVACVWPHGEDFVFFLSAFPKVTELELEDCVVPRTAEADLERYPRQYIDTVPGRALRALTVTWSSSEDLEDIDLLGFVHPWLSRLRDVAPEGLRFNWSPMIGFSVLPDYLRALGPVLSELEIALISGDTSCPDFGIDWCTQLRHVTFGSLCWPGWSPEDETEDIREYSWVPRMLAQIRSPQIETVQLTFEPKALTDFQLLDIELVDTILSRPPFASTRVIVAFPPQVFLRRDPLEGGIHGFFIFAASLKFKKVTRHGRLYLSAYGLSRCAAMPFPKYSLDVSAQTDSLLL